MSPYCEDYPCCGHGPPPMGDGGGCPDSEGRFLCVECGRLMPRGASSAVCSICTKRQWCFRCGHSWSECFCELEEVAG